MDNWQGTLNEKVNFVGVGLHSAQLVKIEVHPAAANTGIIFHRSDLPGALPVLAHPFNIKKSELCTLIGEGDSKISTIEHLMAAFKGLGIDNAYVCVDAEEIPILDGSAAPFVDKLREVGIRKLPFQRKILLAKRALIVRRDDQWIKMEPQAFFSIHTKINFASSSVIGEQEFSFKLHTDSFDILNDARTFCHRDDVELMKQRGLAQGGSLDNAIVVDNEKVLNASGLRYDNEFARHKLLDCLGDLALLGGDLRAKITSYKAGHALHCELASELILRQHELLRVIEPGTEPYKENSRENGIAGLGLVAQGLQH